MKTTKPIQIKTVEQLQAAAYEKRSVICPNCSGAWNRATPASFMINQIGVVLVRLFASGMFLYEKRPIDKFSYMPWSKKHELQN